MSNPERWHKFPPLPADIHARLAALPDLFARRGVRLAYLFGSLVHGRSGRDVDLALLTAADAPPFTLRDPIVEALNTERVDIVDLRRASPPLRFHIVSTGRVLYAAGEEIENRFELATLHRYRDMAPMRRRQEMYLRERLSHMKGAR